MTFDGFCGISLPTFIKRNWQRCYVIRPEALLHYVMEGEKKNPRRIVVGGKHESKISLRWWHPKFYKANWTIAWKKTRYPDSRLKNDASHNLPFGNVLINSCITINFSLRCLLIFPLSTSSTPFLSLLSLFSSPLHSVLFPSSPSLSFQLSYVSFRFLSVSYHSASVVLRLIERQWDKQKRTELKIRPCRRW